MNNTTVIAFIFLTPLCADATLSAAETGQTR